MSQSSYSAATSTTSLCFPTVPRAARAGNHFLQGIWEQSWGTWGAWLDGYLNCARGFSTSVSIQMPVSLPAQEVLLSSVPTLGLVTHPLPLPSRVSLEPGGPLLLLLPQPPLSPSPFQLPPPCSWRSLLRGRCNHIYLKLSRRGADTGTLVHSRWECKWHSGCGSQVAAPYRVKHAPTIQHSDPTATSAPGEK